jgi:CheY-like chemotaxis protein
VFTLYLPITYAGPEQPLLRDAAALVPAATPTTASVAGATGWRGGEGPAGDSGTSLPDYEAPLKRLLVVDPEDTVTRAIGGLIGSDKGVAVTGAASPAEALAAVEAEESPWDCIVVALTPPRSSGLELIESLRRRPDTRLTPVIAYTTRPLSPRQQARLEGVAGAPNGPRLATTPARLLGETAMVLHRRDGAVPRLDPPDAQDGSAVLEGRKILLVDDDVRNLFALASLLEDRGIEVVFGETGKEALAALERHPDTDLVLMDIMMPDMDGYQTTAAIRGMPRFRDLPIIALTAKAMQGDREKSLRSGASDHITKPVDPGRLLMVLKSWMARRA